MDFLAGGPGLGSESLNGLSEILHLPGTTWHLDLPGDGSNLTEDDSQYFSHWSEALVEAVAALDRVILVAHSTGGMYTLATPELDDMLDGLILIDSVPDASWQQIFMEYVRIHPLKEVEKLQKIYIENPSNETLKKLTIASSPYVFTEKGLKNCIPFLEELPINYKTFEWSALHFDKTYKAKWIPNNIPTLIFAGDEDHITPLSLFSSSEEFQHENILIKKIPSSGHYPWIENPTKVKALFDEYYQILKNHSALNEYVPP